jgi:NitT/TauT family transport system substrate-binding protein
MMSVNIQKKLGRFAMIYILCFALALPLSSCGPSTTSQTIRIGTMATEDMLPYWVAEQELLFSAVGLNVEIITFQSAQELSTAFSVAEIDMAMTDPMVSISLAAAGVPLELLWVTLGQTASEGRFGILAHPDSGIKSLQDLAGVPVAVGSNTIAEYTFDRLMYAAGFSTDQIRYVEVKKVPVRYEMVANNQVAAGAFPASLLYFGEQSGLVLVADDTTGENISQTVMVARQDFVDSVAATDTLALLAKVWDEAVALINSDPAIWRPLLAQKAQLPAAIAENYPVPKYPSAARPTDWMIESVLSWMTTKGYLKVSVSYDHQTGALSK